MHTILLRQHDWTLQIQLSIRIRSRNKAILGIRYGGERVLSPLCGERVGIRSFGVVPNLKGHAL